MGDLNEPQRRHLVTTFKHVDELLVNALAATHAVDSPFAEYVADTKPAQRKMLQAHVRELRITMVRILEHEEIAVPPPAISAAWAFRTAIVSARLDVEELRPRCLRGFGPVSAASTGRLDAAVAELLAQPDRMEACLAQMRAAPTERP